MKAARFYEPLDLRIEQVAEPVAPPGGVVIEIEAALTCGTDAKCYLRGHPVLLGPAPAAFGHEYAGVVVAADEASGWRVGQRVAGANSAPCGTCQACLRDREELCEDLYPLLNGAYGELLAVPARIAAVNLHAVPDGVPGEVAAALEPLACAIHGADDAGVRPGVRVGIIGRGPLARMLGVVCAARGATADLLARGEGRARDYEIVIEAAGANEAWSHAIDLTAPGGTVVLFGGLPRGSTVQVDTYRVHYEAITLRGSFHHRPRDVQAAIAMIAADPTPIRALLTHEFGLDEVVEPLRRTAGLAPRDGLLKAVIRPG